MYLVYTVSPGFDIKLTLTLRSFDLATQLPTMHFTIDNNVACYITSNLLDAGPKYVIDVGMS